MNPENTGRSGEIAARRFLEKSGFRFRGANVRSPIGEIDLVMEDPERHELVFVEVKTRRGHGFGRPAEALTRQKRSKLERLIAWYCTRFGWNGQVRLDVVEVLLDASDESSITHIPYVGVQD